MKLTPDQIQTVEAYLNNKDVEYIDLHLEVLDHISTAIETKMTEKSISFNESFEEVKLKWEASFDTEYMYLLGYATGEGSKVFIDKCKRVYRPILYKSIGFFVVLLVALYFLVNNNVYPLESKSFLLGTKGFIGFSILLAALLTFLNIKLKKEKYKSTYSYLYTKMFYTFLGGLYFAAIYMFLSSEENTILYMAALIILFSMCLHFYKNHLKVVSNYKKYQLQ